MKRTYLLIALCLVLLFSIAYAHEGSHVLPAPNGIEIPQNYKDWRIISPSHRTDNNTIRVTLGNDTAIYAARNNKTKPWPEGTILAKLVWKDTSHNKWGAATLPGEFVHAEFMIKDSKKYSKTGGWGFARWKGLDQDPYGKDASFVQECFGCHKPVKDNDYVFTAPAVIP